MAALRACAAICVAATFLAYAGVACGEVRGVQMVGAGIPPDTLLQDDRELDHCTWSGHSTSGPGFTRWPILDDVINEDIDLLYSDGLDTLLLASEVNVLLKAFDKTFDNAFDVDERDLELLLNYLSAEAPYDSTATPHFELFSPCDDEKVGIAYRDEVDFYLVKYGEPGLHTTFGAYVAPYISAIEDEPWDPANNEYHHNSFQVTDSRGNATQDTTVWPLKTAKGGAHELGHMIWASNTELYGSRWGNNDDFNELLATAAGFVSGTLPGSLVNDKPYGQSIIGFLGGSYCSSPGTDPNNCPSWADYEDCLTRYSPWSLFSAYLGDRFHNPSGYEDDLLYKWARHRESSGEQKLRRDMCGLADELNASYYSYLDGDDGWERLREIFHDCAIAKWVDNGDLDSAYDFGDLISPTASFGLFMKIDDNPLTGDTLSCWELAIPPTFHVGSVSDTAWRYVPGNGSDPDDPDCNGWNDPAEESNDFCGNSYCDSVTVRFWGSDYIAFIADTTYYNADEDDAYLRIELDWGEGAMDDSTELWVSLLKYGCAPDSLFLCGSKLEHVTTGQFDSSDAGLAINIYEFHEGGTEAAAVVLSLVQKYEDLNRTNCNVSFHPQSCLTRHASAPRDLDYSYAFRVLRETPGGGCPFVEVLSGEQYVADNNVLAGCVGSEDEVDAYVLSALQASDEEIGLRISENERERSSFNRVTLLAVDAPSDCEVGVLDGTVITAYRGRTLPVAAFDPEGHDLLAAISEDDGQRVLIEGGSRIELRFEIGGRAGGGLLLKTDPVWKIDPPGGRGGGGDAPGVVDLTPLCYRENECANLVSLPTLPPPDGETTSITLTTPVDLWLDEVFLTHLEGEDAVTTTPCELLSAEHDVHGESANAIASADGAVLTLAPSQFIDLVFAAPASSPGHLRRYVLETEGHYEHIGDLIERDADSDAEVPSLAAFVSPNPVVGNALISLRIPHPGGLVTVDIYNVAGRRVRQLLREELPEGTHSVVWDGLDDHGRSVASGAYFCRVEALGQMAANKLLILK